MYISKAHEAAMLSTHTPAGYHPETYERFMMSNSDRFRGMTILGGAGLGKSGLMQNLIYHDAIEGRAVITLDPHTDLIMDSIAQLPDKALRRVSLLDLEDEAYPFGLNLLSSLSANSGAALSHSVDKVAHVFETLWAQSLDQIYLPRYLRAASMVLLANPGSTLVDMPRLFIDNSYRHTMLKAVNNPSVRQTWQDYESLPLPERRQQVMPLVARLESLFMGRSLITGIVGQASNTVDFRRAIENREIIYVKLPMRTLPLDSRLIGILIITQLHDAIFSFGDLPESQRPGVSVYVDEFALFANPDFAVMFSEGRKFGLRTVLAHQYRSQLPKYLKDATNIAGIKVCFGLNHEDAKDMAHYYVMGETEVKPEDIETKPVDYLLSYGSDSYNVQTFVNTYLRHVHVHKKAGVIEIQRPGLRTDHARFHLLGVTPPKDMVTVPDPVPHLNHLFYQAMKSGYASVPIPIEAFAGLANCGMAFYWELRTSTLGLKKLLSPSVTYPSYLVVPTDDGGTRWTRRPESAREQMLHCLYHLRETMAYLALNPIGRKSAISANEVAVMLTQLPKRAAFVRAGDEAGVIYTDDTPEKVDDYELGQRLDRIREQTRARYCRPIHPLNVAPLPSEQPPYSRWEEVK